MDQSKAAPLWLATNSMVAIWQDNTLLERANMYTPLALWHTASMAMTLPGADPWPLARLKQ